MNGVIVLNKPAGLSSNTAVNIVKKAVGAKKAGHLGTLDVLGDGVLPVTLGKATRLFDHFLTKRKTYEAVFAFGFQTETLDAEGQVEFEKIISLEQTQIEQVLPNFVGKIMQKPPVFSALKKGGKPAYEIARKGGSVELEERQIEIYSFKILGKPSKEEQQILEQRFLKFHSQTEFEKFKHVFENCLYKFEIECSAGTYIRSLCRDLAHSTATYGTMLSITRTKCGNFELENSFSLEQIKNGVFSVVSAFDAVDLPVLEVSKLQATDILNGKPVFVLPVLQGEFKLVCEKKFYGIAKQDENGKIKIKTFLLER